MVMMGEFPGHDGALLACSDALAAAGRWEAAARFGERVADPDPLRRADIAWKLLRAGRPERALARLDGLPDDLHPALGVLRAAAVALHDPTPDALTALLREPDTSTAVGLRLVTMVACAVGDRATAVQAASDYLDTADPNDGPLRALVAPEQALNGDVTDAVLSAECAAASQLDPDAAVRAVVAEMDRHGRPGLVPLFLATGYLRTGREVYGSLLATAVPVRVRHLLRYVLGAVACTLVGVGLLVTGIGALAVAGAVSLAAGVGLMLATILQRVPGLDRGRSRGVQEALGRFRARTGSTEVLPAAVALAAGAFAFSIMSNRGAGGALAPAAVLAAVGWAAAVGVVASGLLVAARWRRRRARRMLAAVDEVGADRCRCWGTDRLLGHRWDTYLAGHLGLVGADEALGATLLRCPATHRLWLHLPSEALAATVRLPEAPSPQPATGT